MNSNLTVFENHSKKSHKKLRRKRPTFTFCVDKKFIKNAKIVHFGQFFESLNLALPDRSILIRQKLLENAKIKNSCETF